MLASIASRFSRMVERYLPDAFVIAVIMTLIVFFAGWLMNISTPMALIESWGEGFWTYLAFTMQMVMLLMTGMVLAAVPFISKGLEKLAGLSHGKKMPYVLVFLITSFAYFINWGLAVVVGAILAREVGKRNKEAHFPLLVASAYAPTVLYTAGLSSSIGLTVATEGHFLEDLMGVIPTSQTIFHPSTVLILIALVITIPVFIVLMAPKDKSAIIPFREGKSVFSGKKAKTDSGGSTPAKKLETTPVLGFVSGAIGLVFILSYFFNGGDLDLNIINLLFLSAGLFFHQSLGQFAGAFKEAATSISPIILQFPFYAGIIGLLGSSGLGQLIIDGMVSAASAGTFTVFSYWAAGFVNILAPSGGGQWALQGPLQIPAAIELGVDPAKTAMAVGWGDAWTNLIQPFWALPILSIVGLSIRHIMGYCILLSVWVGVLTSVLIFFLY
ncbi:short-chain fatty acid transporter [Salipaludibacillus aurantiacus]|uniref:Short-chain fatty acids transporter n=1 Tax=Salipaludibacillus aurantiacus TaxID=1601833 RepID=A0A1H9W2Z5_9BACI|nr:TIGR00366 family protein [Salipaludibacillus aurantiacus]SES28320.1 short-chain fatty acids transporter [Salipaludibacillus aurantiacus]